MAKAWALREVWKEQGRPTYGMHTFIAEKVTKVGGGHPLPLAVKKLLERTDEDLCILTYRIPVSHAVGSYG